MVITSFQCVRGKTKTGYTHAEPVSHNTINQNLPPGIIFNRQGSRVFAPTVFFIYENQLCSSFCGTKVFYSNENKYQKRTNNHQF